MDIKELKNGNKKIIEPRRTGYGNIRHRLEDIIIIGLCTVICGGEDFVDMEAFGKSRQEYLAKFLELPNGIPDSDTFRRVFEKLNPSELSSCLINWVSAERTKRGTVAIDGKTICGSGRGCCNRNSPQIMDTKFTKQHKKRAQDPKKPIRKQAHRKKRANK